MKASLSNYRQTPRKVRVVTDLIKGKRVEEALTTLRFLPKRAAAPIHKLIASAVANAEKNFGADRATLVVENITVDKGMVLKRMMPRARGSAARLKKRASHVTVTLSRRAATAAKITKTAKTTSALAVTPSAKTSRTTAKSASKPAANTQVNA